LGKTKRQIKLIDQSSIVLDIVADIHDLLLSAKSGRYVPCPHHLPELDEGAPLSLDPSVH
jgi:hypothetical protein